MLRLCKQRVRGEINIRKHRLLCFQAVCEPYSIHCPNNSVAKFSHTFGNTISIVYFSAVGVPPFCGCHHTKKWKRHRHFMGKHTFGGITAYFVCAVLPRLSIYPKQYQNFQDEYLRQINLPHERHALS